MGRHPIGITNSDDCVRSRLTVFFRYLLATPHFIWLELWAIAAFFVAIASWFATLATGRNPEPLHRFNAAFLRYSTHVYAFLLLIGNPFPGFTGAAGTYPVNLLIEPAAPQNRWKTLFRGLLVLPALLLTSVLVYVLYVAALLGWFSALATGRMPTGLQRAGVYVLRYQGQVHGYLLLLCDRYPYSGPESEWGGGGPGPVAGGGPAGPRQEDQGAPEGGVAVAPAGSPAQPTFRDPQQATPPAGE